ncbi:flagellar filament capping protein FliD [Cryptosporangium phraense]|uniref:Flagellar hook-associated protein 2 n=1 Tax=Cryptosporangium phraense TaxID=2593070 RepID=A0A545AGA7_9ACTN|nr:flagellar filament capping protein FliD [Cryptosporangium phraense]TQS39675.1 flagellar hook protein [Cryptosporangium phraense]
MTTSIGGLASGLDTTTLINSLIQAESAPQTALKTKVSDYTTSNSAYQTINGKMKSLLTAAQDLTRYDAFKVAKATSTSTDVVATASTGAQTGDMTFSVTKLANAHRVTAAFASTDTAAVTDGSSFNLTVGTGDDAKQTSISLGDEPNTPQGVANAINNAKLGVRASVVTTDSGPVLQLASTKSGAANAFTLDGLTSDPKVMTAGADAELTVGDPAAGGFKVTSSSNTFTGVMPGVTITANKLASDVTVGVNSDTDAMATKMQALVDAANGALAQISSAAASGVSSTPGSKATGGPLAGDYTVRQLSSQMLSAVSTGQSGFGSFKQLGIELTRDGKLQFNKDNFVKAYNDDPAKIQDAVSNGLAKTLESVSKSATDVVSGTLTQKIQSGTTMISRLNQEISDWDVKLADRRSALQRQFTAMETALNNVKSQSNWLSSQTAAANSSSS